MMQLSINLNEATAARKLQDVTKEKLIIDNWTYSHGWVYIVCPELEHVMDDF